MEENQEETKDFNWGKVEWGKRIAGGAYGIVFLCQYGGKKVAIKVICAGEEDIDGVETAELSFLREVSTCSLLDHPNIAKFITAKEDVNPPLKDLKNSGFCGVIVSEYLEGGTLASYVRHHKKLALKEKIKLALEVARGLYYLHSKNIAHRDVKLDNLLLDGQGRVKIIDFGVSRIETEDMSVKVGTKGYIAPEVLVSNSYNHRCDVFSFGICLWELYYLKRFGSSLASSTPQIGKDCPKKLADLMRRCWTDPSTRPEMAEVVKTLEDVLKKAERSPFGCFSFLKR
ncbi:OLC1v1012162C1 [Oldenlandia corymbosa var. corymbosa]|uniref:OLC1v1012162C1 n=1 Tax=Oldenlandia corymbosa var. corymbosa TaxID=529605 RepID=A0AAV1DYH8_OLDCO|nr:OLC1v1012162C1 [Oldenlandia corymbosa var. corymbosa]